MPVTVGFGGVGRCLEPLIAQYHFYLYFLKLQLKVLHSHDREIQQRNVGPITGVLHCPVACGLSV